MPARLPPHVGDNGPDGGVVLGLRRVVDAVDGAPRREGLHDLVDQVGDVVDDKREGRRAVQAFRRQVVDEGGACPHLGQVRKGDHVDAAVAGVEAVARRGDGRVGGRLKIQNCDEVAGITLSAADTCECKPSVLTRRKSFC